MEVLFRLTEAWWPLYAVHLLEVSLFILLVWAVDRWVRLDAGVRYGLWLLALVKMFVPPFYAVSLPAFLAAEPVGPMVALGEVLGDATVFEVPVAEMGASVSPVVYAFCLWAASALIFAGVALWRNARFLRSLRAAQPVQLSRNVCELDGVGDLQVFAKADLSSPLLAGLWRPRLYLPSHWSSWTPDQLRGVVAHELAHYRRRDVWALLFQVLATVLFGLNPLVWVVNRRLSLLRELRCDEAALRESGVSPVVYGKLLYDFLEGRKRSVLAALYFTEEGAALKKRFEHVLNFKEDDMRRSKWRLAIPVLVGLMIVPFSIRETYSEVNVEVPINVRAPMGAVLAQKLNQKDGMLERMGTGALQYPEALRTSGAEGYVLMELAIGADGRVTEMQMLEGDARFEEAARTAFLQFRFRVPENGQPVRLTQGIVYRIHQPNRDYQIPQELIGKSDLSPMIVVAAPDAGPVRFRIAFQGQGPQGGDSNKPVQIHVSRSRVSEIWINAQGALLLDMEKEVAIENLAQEIERLKREKGTQRIQIKLDTGAPDQVVSAVKEAARQADLRATMVYEFYQLQDKPEPIHTVAPKYPEAARKQGLSGRVFLKFLVNEDGSVSDVKMLGGDEVFRQAAIDAIRQFRFKPAQQDGRPIAVWMTQPIAFRLDTRPDAVDVETRQNRDLPIAPPAAFKLHANFPNPFNPETTIAYELAEATPVTLEIYAVTGQVIRTLVSGPQAAGRYQVRWDATDAAGRSVASGTYYYRLTTDQFSDVKQMLLLK